MGHQHTHTQINRQAKSLQPKVLCSRSFDCAIKANEKMDRKKKIKQESFHLLSSILFYLILYVIFSVGFYPERLSVEVSEGRHQRSAQLRHTDKEEHTLLKASFSIRLRCLSPPEVYLSFSAQKRKMEVISPRRSCGKTLGVNTRNDKN